MSLAVSVCVLAPFALAWLSMATIDRALGYWTKWQRALDHEEPAPSPAEPAVPAVVTRDATGFVSPAAKAQMSRAIEDASFDDEVAALVISSRNRCWPWGSEHLARVAVRQRRNPAPAPSLESAQAAWAAADRVAADRHRAYAGYPRRSDTDRVAAEVQKLTSENAQLLSLFDAETLRAIALSLSKRLIDKTKGDSDG